MKSKIEKRLRQLQDALNEYTSCSMVAVLKFEHPYRDKTKTQRIIHSHIDSRHSDFVGLHAAIEEHLKRSGIDEK